MKQAPHYRYGEVSYAWELTFGQIIKLEDKGNGLRPQALLTLNWAGTHYLNLAHLMLEGNLKWINFIERRMTTAQKRHRGSAGRPPLDWHSQVDGNIWAKGHAYIELWLTL